LLEGDWAREGGERKRKPRRRGWKREADSERLLSVSLSGIHTCGYGPDSGQIDIQHVNGVDGMSISSSGLQLSLFRILGHREGHTVLGCITTTLIALNLVSFREI